MKTHIKHLANRLRATVLLCGLLAAAAHAAVPIRWSVDVSRAPQPVQFTAYRGETLSLAADFHAYGKPLDLGAATVALYYQTNGMDQAWWNVSASAHTNRIEATFTPSDDPGADSLICFLGSPATSYRAAFRLRFVGAPGAVPNDISPPVTRLDFSGIEVANAPWATPADVASATNALAASTAASLSYYAPLSALAGYAPLSALTDYASLSYVNGNFFRGTWNGYDFAATAEITLYDGYIVLDNSSTMGDVLNISYQSVMLEGGGSAQWRDIFAAANGFQSLAVATTNNAHAVAIAATNYTYAAAAAATNYTHLAAVAATNYVDSVVPSTAAATSANVVRYCGGKLTVNVSSGGTLSASTADWRDGASVFAKLVPAGSYTVSGITLVGYGSWPTNTAQCVFWRCDNAVFCNVIKED